LRGNARTARRAVATKIYPGIAGKREMEGLARYNISAFVG
jgi:hypothetical protein